MMPETENSHSAFGYFTLPAEKTDELLTHDWKLQLVSRCMTHNMSMNFFKLKDVKTVVVQRVPHESPALYNQNTYREISAAPPTGCSMTSA